MFKRIVAVAALLSGVIPTYQAWAQPRAGSPAQHRPLPDFDTRDAAPPSAALSDRDQTNRIVETRRRAIQSFLSTSAARPGIRIAPNRFGLPKTYTREGRPLTAPSTADPQDIARDFLRANRSLFPLTPTEISALRLVTKDASSSAVFLTFNQTLNGIDVFDGQIKLTLTAAGEIVHAGADQVVPGLSLSTNAQLTATQAVSAAMANAGVIATLPAPAVAEGKTTFRNPRGERYSPITAELFIFPMDAAAARLAYRIFLEADNDCWYEILIDAQTGDLLLRHNLYTHAAQARVWVQSPLDTDRQLVTFPDAWLPANATVTTGNNADAYLDANGDDRPDNTTTGPLNNGRASASNQIFDFPFGDGMTNQNPRSFQAAAVTNLFYLINIAHDYYYKLGFTEAAGNFQTDNFGKGGLANDAVIAEAQQPGELDNASFAPTVDGTAPKIRMGLFTNDTTTQTDDLDSSYDGMVVVHEYGHGVSNRLVGSRTSVSCLNGIQSGAMGEGWSDYFAISYFNNPVQGAYLVRDPVNGFRRHSYEGYPYTYEDIGNEGYEVHNDGEIWAATLWDLRKALGQTVTDLLVINGLKSTPCHPSMTDARDAILAADQATNAGANRAKIWQAFAKHGLGFSAAGIDGDQYPGIYYNAAYDQPVDLQPGGNPAITSTPPTTLPQFGDLFTYTVAASNPAAGALSYALSAGPAGMSIDNKGVLQWTTGFIQQRVKITITDGKGGKVVHGFILTPNTAMADGKPITISGFENDLGYATFTVPAGTPVLQVAMHGGSGDADLDIFDPNGLDFYSQNEGNDETLSISNPKTGVWRIQVTGYLDFRNVVLQASAITPTTIAPNTPLTGLSGAITSETFYRVIVPQGATSLAITTSGGSGDVDLYVKNGRPAVCQSSDLAFAPCVYDRSSTKTGNGESVSITSPAAGDWYIDLSAFDVYSGVTLTATLAAPPTLSVAASAVTFTAVESGTAPAAQPLAFSDPSGSAFAWTAAAATTTGGNWLTISKTSGTGGSTLQVTADPKGLAAGSYQGSVTITAASLAGSPVTIPVTLTVTAQPSLFVPTTPIAFQTTSGQDAPSQTLGIGNAGGGTLNWTAVVATTGSGWLKVTPSSGTVNASRTTLSAVQVSASAATLAAGSYSGTVTITAAGAKNSPAVVNVTFTVSPAAPTGPAISAGGIVGGGGSLPAVTLISPGGLATIFGSAFAPAGTLRAVQSSDLVNGNLPTNLAGTCVIADGKSAFLTFVSAGQINFQVPAVTTDAVVNVQVVANCGTPDELRGAPATVRTAAASPEFLYWIKNADGKDPVIAVNAITGGYAGAPGLIPGLTFAPVKPGDILTIYGVSFGPVTPTVDPGAAPASTAGTANTASVTLGTVTLAPADVLYAGVSPGIAGLYQLNIRVPANAPDGDLPLTLTLGSFKTPSLGFLTVRSQ